MENVYNIRHDKNLYFVLPDLVKNDERTTIEKGEMAVIIHLHYEDTVDKYFNYICNIPKDIDVYISVSNEKARVQIERNIEKYQLPNCSIVIKENRGRDISALLVACREIALKYEYICFTHDKREKHAQDKALIDEYVASIWTNLLASETYIYNVKNVFEMHPDIGILAVPEGFWERSGYGYSLMWDKDYELMLELAKKLQINCNLDEALPPITMGTAFWARTKALYKLFSYPWSYQDFDAEPLPDDGTISHAIERSLAYVAQDAGYDTGTLRTIPYAQKHIGAMQNMLRLSFEYLQKLGIFNCEDILKDEKRRANYRSFFQRFEEVYLYGAGIRGEEELCLLKSMGLQPKAFLVTANTSGLKDVGGVPVKEWRQMEITEKTGIVITVGSRYKQEIVDILEEKNFYNYI